MRFSVIQACMAVSPVFFSCIFDLSITELFEKNMFNKNKFTIRLLYIFVPTVMSFVYMILDKQFENLWYFFISVFVINALVFFDLKRKYRINKNKYKMD